MTKEEKVEKIISSIGFRQECLGFSYLKECVMYVLQNPEYLFKTTSLYKIMAEKLQIPKWLQVSANIHKEVLYAHEEGKLKALNKWFGFVVITEQYIPSNGEMIGLIAEIVNSDLEQKMIVV